MKEIHDRSRLPGRGASGRRNTMKIRSLAGRLAALAAVLLCLGGLIFYTTARAEEPVTLEVSYGYDNTAAINPNTPQYQVNNALIERIHS